MTSKRNGRTQLNADTADAMVGDEARLYMDMIHSVMPIDKKIIDTTMSHLMETVNHFNHKAFPPADGTPVHVYSIMEDTQIQALGQLINVETKLLLILPYNIIVDYERERKISLSLVRSEQAKYNNAMSAAVLEWHSIRTYKETCERITKYVNGFTLIKTYDFGNKKIYGIYNFCKKPTLDGSYGKTLFAAVHNYLNNLPKVANVAHYYWLQIDFIGEIKKKHPENVSKLIALYGSFGFKNPYISQYEPTGFDRKQPFLCLFKKAGDPIATNTEVVQLCRKSHYLMYNYVTRWEEFQRTKDVTSLMFPIKLVFGKDLQLFLKSQIYCTLDVEHLFTTEGDYNYEVCGYMTYDKILKVNNATDPCDRNTRQYPSRPQDIYELNMIVLDYGNFQTIQDRYDKCSPGDYTNSYMFHTHPLSWYITTRVLLATPSTPDIIAFLDHHMSNNITGICHFVATLEGIYTISVKRPISLQSAQTYRATPRELIYPYLYEIFEYPLFLRHFSWPGQSDEVFVEDTITNKMRDLNLPAPNDTTRSLLEVRSDEYFEYLKNKKIAAQVTLANNQWLIEIIEAIDITLHPWTALEREWDNRITVYSPMKGYNSSLDYEEFDVIANAIQTSRFL